MRTVLVVANETMGSAQLMQRAEEEAAKGPLRVVLCVPRKNPPHGNVIYADAVYEAAQVRVDLGRGVLREMGIDSIGEVGDPDPYVAATDAIAEHQPDLVIISTFPAPTSGWLKRDFVARIAAATKVPVEHIVSKISDGVPFDETLVVANRTANSEALLPQLTSMPVGKHPRLFIFVVPRDGGDAVAVKRSQARLAQVIDRAHAEGLLAAGMVGDPDPYTATMNALDFFPETSDVVISTYSATRSGWLRADLIERIRKASGRNVQHVVTREGADTSAA